MGTDSDVIKRGNGRNRVKYSKEQLELLDRTFTLTQYPDTATLEELADKLNVTLEKVSIWFQNRRSKFKRQSKDVHVAWMRKQFYGTEHAQQVPTTSGSLLGRRHVLSPPEPKREQYEQTTWHKPTSNLHYLPQLSPFMESLLDLSSSSSTSSGSPPSSTMTSPESHMTASSTGSSPESPPFRHRAFYLHPFTGSQQYNGSPPSYALPSCQFYNTSYSPLPYPAQPQFPSPVYQSCAHQNSV